MIDQFAAVLIKKIDVLSKGYESDLNNNKMKTIEDYRYNCGLIRGLAMAREEIEDLAKRAEEAE